MRQTVIVKLLLSLSKQILTVMLVRWLETRSRAAGTGGLLGWISVASGVTINFRPRPRFAQSQVVLLDGLRRIWLESYR